MKRGLTHILPVLLALVFLAACDTEKEDLRSQQQTRIESYLRSTHQPHLVPFGETVEGEQQPHYTASGQTVYRYIANLYSRPDREQQPEVTASSTVEITFRAYVFSYRNIVSSGQNITMPYYTNDPELYEALSTIEGFDPSYWSFEPLRLDMRRSKMLEGLYRALIGCRAGDEVEAYMTSNMAYDDENFVLIPRDSPVAIFFTVNRVE